MWCFLSPLPWKQHAPVSTMQSRMAAFQDPQSAVAAPHNLMAINGNEVAVLPQNFPGLCDILVMFLHLDRLNSINALFTLPFRYVCWCWPQMHAFAERFWLLCAVKEMLGLDDSEKRNLLEKNPHCPLPWHFKSACVLQCLPTYKQWNTGAW